MDTKEQKATDMVDDAKYPPRGRRGSRILELDYADEGVVFVPEYGYSLKSEGPWNMETDEFGNVEPRQKTLEEIIAKKGQQAKFLPPEAGGHQAAPAGRVWRGGIMRAISPFGMPDLNHRSFNQRWTHFTWDAEGRGYGRFGDEQDWKIDLTALRKITPIDAARSLTEAFRLCRADGYWQAFEDMLKQGPRSLRIDSGVKRWKDDGTYDWGAEDEDEDRGENKQTTGGKETTELAKADALLFNLESVDWFESGSNFLDMVEQTGKFAAIYMGPAGAVQKATYELIVSRFRVDRYTKRVEIFHLMHEACKDRVHVADDPDVDELPDALRILIEAENDPEEIARIRSDYKQQWAERRDFVRDVLSVPETFNEDPVGNATRTAELVNTAFGALQEPEFIGLRNFANMANNAEMNPDFDPYGTERCSKNELRNRVTMVMAHMVKARLYPGTEYKMVKVGNVEKMRRIEKGGWRERVFIQVPSASSLRYDLDVKHADVQIAKWVFSDQPQMFFHLGYIMPALYKAHREYSIRQLMMVAGPELHSKFKAHREALAETEAKAGKQVPDWIKRAKQKSASMNSNNDNTDLRRERKPLPISLIPNVMAFFKARYKA